MNEMLSQLRRKPVALSIRQPWAHHILHEGKDIENRDWWTRFRGPVLIHAGKAYDGQIPRAHADLPRGGIVGMVEIIDCVSRSDSQWFMGKFGFVLRNPVPLAFIPCPGKLGFFTPAIDAALLAPECCPVCGGDCAGANPPVLHCPMKAASDKSEGDEK